MAVQDLTPPGAPTLSTTPTSPANENDVHLVGIAEIGSTVTLFPTNDCTGSPAGSDVADGAGAFDVLIVVTDNSISTFSADATDAADNTSACSEAVDYVEDSQAPDVPALTGSDPVSPFNDNTPILSGESDPTATVRLFINSNCSGTPLQQVVPANDGSFSFEVVVPDDFARTFYVDARDEVGHIGPCSTGFTFVEDSTVGFAVPTLTGTVPVSPSSVTDIFIDGASPQSGALVQIFQNADCTGAPATEIDLGSSFDFFWEVSVPDNSTTSFSARSTDGHGNFTACSAPISYVQDSEAPPPPIITGTNPVSPSDDNSPRVFGTTEGGATQVNLYATSDCTGGFQLNLPSNFASPGFEVSVPTNATTSITARARDAAGNLSDCSAPITYQELSTNLETEPNDSSGTANPIPVGDVIEGAIAPVADKDWYALTVPAGYSIRAETFDRDSARLTCAGSVDTFIRLFAPDGTTELASDDQDGLGFCGKIDPVTDVGARNLAPGTYFVSVEDFGNNSTINGYQLMLQAVDLTAEEAEPNNSAATATPLMTRAKGAISPTGDFDVYSVFVPEGQGIIAQTTDITGTSCGGIDTTLELRSNGGATSLILDDNDGVDDCSRIDATLDPAAANLTEGIYQLIVRDFNDDGTIPGYRLALTLADTGAITESEPNENMVDADAKAANPNFSISNSRTLLGSISLVADKDMYKVVVPTGGPISFETFSGAGTCSGITTTLRLVDSLGATLTTDNNLGIANCSSISRFLTAGTYYVSVEESGNNATIADYRLRVNFPTAAGTDTEPNDTTGTATPITTPFNGFIQGEHQVATDQDLYAFTVPANGSVRLEVIEGGGETCEGNSVDSEIELLDSGGAVIAGDDDAGRGFCSLIDGTGVGPLTQPTHVGASTLSAGTYYLRVRATDASTALHTKQFDYRVVVSIRTP
jgi:hypothetical protein